MKQIPFVANTKDDLHCQQAAYMMIAKYYNPDFDIQWDKWSEITGFEKDKGTWASASLLWFLENGYIVEHISLFDYEKFVRDQGKYLVATFGEQVGTWQIEHTNMELEVQRARELLGQKAIKKREPTIEDIKQYLNRGYLLRVLVNSRRLNNKSGYFGHSVVVSDIDETSITIQDPGLPPRPNREVPIETFKSAWADPNAAAKELDAIRLN